MNFRFAVLLAATLLVCGEGFAQESSTVELTGFYSYFRFNPENSGMVTSNSLNGGGVEAILISRYKFSRLRITPNNPNIHRRKRRHSENRNSTEIKVSAAIALGKGYDTLYSILRSLAGAVHSNVEGVGAPTAYIAETFNARSTQKNYSEGSNIHLILNQEKIADRLFIFNGDVATLGNYLQDNEITADTVRVIPVNARVRVCFSPRQG